MATDRIGIGHRTGEIAGALMSSGTKRKVEELGGHVLSAAVSDVVARTMSAAVGRYEARASVDDQLERLRTLAIMVHSAVEAAEDVHIRSWWLRRWHWTLRDAALDADEVLRFFRQRRAAVGTDAASNKQAAGNMVWRTLRSVKSLLFDRDDGGVERLSRMVARLEREAMGLGDFLKVLDLEIRRSLAVQQAPPVQFSVPTLTSTPPAAVHCDNLQSWNDIYLKFCLSEVCGSESLEDENSASPDGGDRSRFDHGVSSISHEEYVCLSEVCGSESLEDENSASPDGGDRSRFDHGVSSISHEEYVAGIRKLGLLIVRQRIWRALDWLMRKMGLLIVMQRIRRALDWLMISRKPVAPPAPPHAAVPDTDRDRLLELVSRIQQAASACVTFGSVTLDFHRKRSWLSRWSSQLAIVAGSAEYLLLAVPAQAGGDGDGADVIVAPRDVSDGRMRTAAQNVETAAAHLEDFVTLTGFALASLGRPCTTGNRLFAECQGVCREQLIGHSAKNLFAECLVTDTRLRREPGTRHSANSFLC